MMTPSIAATIEDSIVPLLPGDLERIAEKRIMKFEPASYSQEDLSTFNELIETGSPISLSGMGRSYTLDLFLNPIFSSEVLENQPLIRPYRGVIRDHDGSAVRLTVDLERNALNAMLRFADGTILNVEPIDDSGGPLHIWYDNDDALVTVPAHPLPPAEEESPSAALAPEPSSDEARAGPSPPEAPGNETAFGTFALAGHNTYSNPRLRVYYDTGTNPTYIVNRIDELWAREMLITFEILGVSTVNTNTWRDDNCGVGNDFYTDFQTNRPLTGTEPNRNDKALLFTENPSNINYQYLGCGGGNHAWVRWGGYSDKQRAIVGNQELGHAFGAPHDDTTRIDHCHFSTGFCWNNHQHWTVMHGTYEGDDSMDETFSASSQGVIEPYAANVNNIPRNAQIWTGSDVSSANVKLTWWEVRYPKNAVGGDTIEAKSIWAANSGTVSLSSVFVGARNGAGANRDFGHFGPQALTTSPTPNGWSYTLPTGQTGTWHFWPAYDSCGSGCYGPFKWHEITFGVN